MADVDFRYAFVAEWYDAHACIVRKYQFLYYTKDETIEMYDVKNRRAFLKRTKCDTISADDLYIGNIVNVFSRQLTFVDFGDQFTASKLGAKKERTLGLIKPDGIYGMGDILERACNAGFRICNIKLCILSRMEAAEFYTDHKGAPYFDKLVTFMSSGPILAVELMAPNGISLWRRLLGPTDSAKARIEQPDCIRAQFGTDGTKNACHGSDSSTTAHRELEFFFPTSGGPERRCASGSSKSQVTCCVIKPHAVKDGRVGSVIKAIQEADFQISAIKLYNMEQANAEEFYEVYKGVVAEYGNMVKELCSGPCIALEISGTSQDHPVDFRNIVGPSDPEIARHLRPNTLRARFGTDKIMNAVHCTDLPEDGILEVEYFFKILAS